MSRGVLITATRVTPEGSEFHEDIPIVIETALIPVSVHCFTAMIPAVDLVEGMIIQCNSDDFLIIDRIAILDDADSP